MKAAATFEDGVDDRRALTLHRMPVSFRPGAANL